MKCVFPNLSSEEKKRAAQTRSEFPSTTVVPGVARLFLAWLLLCLCLFEARIVSAGPLDEWTIRRARPLSAELRGVTYGQGIFVAASVDGTILTSPDAFTWKLNGAANVPFHIAFGNGVFLAVGASGRMMRSTDGAAWTELPRVTSEVLQGITFIGGRFFAVGNRSSILSSPDGLNWTSHCCSGGLNSITYHDGTYVGVGGEYFGGSIAISKDGATWNPQIVTSFGVYDVAYGNGRYVAVGYAKLAISLDGNVWTFHQSPSSSALTGVAFGKGLFVAVGYWGPFSRLFTSEDGLAWKEQLVRGRGFRGVHSVIYAGNRFVAVGTEGTIVTSEDGINWSDPYDDQLAITVGQGMWLVARGKAYYGSFLTSSDGSEWIPGVLPTKSPLSSLFYRNGEFVAYGMGTAFTSADGRSWMAHDTGLTDFISAVTYGNNIYVAAVRYPKSLATSPDGIIWTLQHDAFIQQYRVPTAVAFNGGVFLGFTSPSDGTNIVFTSVNGTNWTETARLRAGSFVSLASGRGTWVAVSEGSIFTSKDGVRWTAQASGGTGNLLAVTYGDGVFVAVGYRGTIITSENGETWTVRKSNVADYLTDIAYHNGRFMVIGPAVILESGDTLRPTFRTAEMNILPDGSTEGSVSVHPPGIISVDSSTNLIDWVPLIERTNTTGLVKFKDTGAKQFNHRFYRAKLQP